MKQIIRTKIKRTETHLDLLVTGHECTDVLSMRVGVFMDTGHMIRGKAFITFDPFIIIKICINAMANKELVFKVARGFGKNIANSAVLVEVFSFTNLLPLRNGGHWDTSK